MRLGGRCVIRTCCSRGGRAWRRPTCRAHLRGTKESAPRVAWAAHLRCKPALLTSVGRKTGPTAPGGRCLRLGADSGGGPFRARVQKTSLPHVVVERKARV